MKRLIAYITVVLGCVLVLNKSDNSDIQAKLLSHNKQQIICLANNIYHEARGETEQGQLAVGLVTMNRVNQSGKTVCEIVHERKPGCQFSWTCAKVAIKEQEAYNNIVAKSMQIISGDVKDFTNGATFYHATYVNPFWSKHKDFKRVARVGRHIFYKKVNHEKIYR
jgi:N-acetylmuramoyl-L-alanine amidase